MQVMCKASNVASDVRCSVCGQGFLVYWTGDSRAQQARHRATILDLLRDHHVGNTATGIHPVNSFLLPSVDSTTPAAPASLLGGAAPWVPA